MALSKSGLILGTVVVFLVLMGQAFGYEVTMSSNVLSASPLGAIAPSGAGTAGDPYVYSFTTAGGLNMGGHEIYGNNQNNKNTTLNLNGRSITGAQYATAFDFHSLVSGVQDYSAHLAITNVGDIRIGKVWTYVPNVSPATVITLK